MIYLNLDCSESTGVTTVTSSIASQYRPPMWLLLKMVIGLMSKTGTITHILFVHRFTVDTDLKRVSESWALLHAVDN